MLVSDPKALGGLALLLLAAGAAWGADEFLGLVRKADSRVEPEEKIEYFSRAIAAWTPPRGNSLLAHCLFRRGEGHYLQNDFDRALPDLAKSLELDPGNARAFLIRGRIAMRRGRFKSASRDFSESASIKEDAEAWWSLGEAEEMSGRWDGARKAYQAAAAAAPEDFHPQLGLARVEMAKKNLRRAMELLDAAGPAPEVLAQRGRFQARPADALADLSRALALFEDKIESLGRAKAAPLALFDAKAALSRTYDARGEVHERRYGFPEALADYEKACDLDFRPACLKADALRRRKPTPAAPFIKPAKPESRTAVAAPLKDELTPQEEVKAKPKKRYKNIRSDPGERYYGN